MEFTKPDGRQVGRVSGTVLVALVVLPFVLIALVQGTGVAQSYVVVSGSMSPAIDAGDVVIIRPVDPAEIGEGDVVTFRRGESEESTPTTHRVVEVVERDDGRSFRTKGDANARPDGRLVADDDVLGEVVLGIPYVGYVVAFGRSPVGIVVLLLVPMALLIATELRNVGEAVRASRAASDGSSPDSTGEGD